MQEAADVGHERNDLRQLAHIEVVHAKGNILLSLVVGRRIKLQACAVVGQEVNESIEVSAVGQSDEVVLVERKVAVRDNWVERCEVGTEAVGKQVDRQAEVHALLSFGIEEGEMCVGSRLCQRSMELRHEGDNAVLRSVRHTGIEGEACFLLFDVPVNTVEQNGACVETMHVAIALQAFLG